MFHKTILFMGVEEKEGFPSLTRLLLLFFFFCCYLVLVLEIYLWILGFGFSNTVSDGPF